MTHLWFVVPLVPLTPHKMRGNINNLRPNVKIFFFFFFCDNYNRNGVQTTKAVPQWESQKHSLFFSFFFPFFNYCTKPLIFFFFTSIYSFREQIGLVSFTTSGLSIATIYKRTAPSCMYFILRVALCLVT